MSILIKSDIGLVVATRCRHCNGVGDLYLCYMFKQPEVPPLIFLAMIEFSETDLIITLEHFDAEDYCKLMQMLIFATRTLADDSTYYPDAYILGVLIEHMLPA